jgi:hypothetical protein
MAALNGRERSSRAAPRRSLPPPPPAMDANISNPRHDSTAGEREVGSRGKGGGADELPASSGSPESVGLTSELHCAQSPVAAPRFRLH